MKMVRGMGRSRVRWKLELCRLTRMEFPPSRGGSCPTVPTALSCWARSDQRPKPLFRLPRVAHAQAAMSASWGWDRARSPARSAPIPPPPARRRSRSPPRSAFASSSSAASRSTTAAQVQSLTLNPTTASNKFGVPPTSRFWHFQGLHLHCLHGLRLLPLQALRGFRIGVNRVARPTVRPRGPRGKMQRVTGSLTHGVPSLPSLQGPRCRTPGPSRSTVRLPDPSWSSVWRRGSR